MYSFIPPSKNILMNNLMEYNQY